MKNVNKIAKIGCLLLIGLPLQSFSYNVGTLVSGKANYGSSLSADEFGLCMASIVGIPFCLLNSSGAAADQLNDVIDEQGYSVETKNKILSEIRSVVSKIGNSDTKLPISPEDINRENLSNDTLDILNLISLP